MKKSLMILVKSGFRRQATFFAIALALVLLFPIAGDKILAESFCISGPDDRPETGVHGRTGF